MTSFALCCFVLVLSRLSFVFVFFPWYNTHTHTLALSLLMPHHVLQTNLRTFIFIAASNPHPRVTHKRKKKDIK